MFPFGAKTPPAHPPAELNVPPPVIFEITPVVGFRTSMFVAPCGTQ